MCSDGMQLCTRETPFYAVILQCRQAERVCCVPFTDGLLLKSLCPCHVECFRSLPSSSCQNIWFSFGEIFVVIFPSGFNYCHWNISGCPAGLIDFICKPSYLWSVADKSEFCFTVPSMKQTEREKLGIGRIWISDQCQICVRDSNMQKSWALLLLQM